MILRDEEIGEATTELIILPDGVDSISHYYLEGIERDRAIARAQVKKVYEWGLEMCSDMSHHKHMTLLQKRLCSDCWLSLLEETE